MFLPRDLLKYLSSQIETLTTDCLNSEQLLKEIIANCSVEKKANRHKPRAYSSQSEDSDVSDLFSHDSVSWKVLSTHSPGGDYVFLPCCDPTTSESEEMNLKCGLSVSDYAISTTSTTMNSPSSSLCPTDSDFSLPDDVSESDRSSLTTVSTIAASSKHGLEVSRARLLWRRAILFVRIVLMLLPQRLKQRKDLPFGECRGEECRGEDAICFDTNVISDNSSNNSFHYKRAMFEKYVKMTKCSDKQPIPIVPTWSLPVDQAEIDLKQDNKESITTVMAERPLVARLAKDTTDALELSLKSKIGSLNVVLQQTNRSQDSCDGRTPPVSSEVDKAVESEINGESIEHRWAETSNTFMSQQSRLCRGDGTKEIITISSHSSVADQDHEKNNQTMCNVKAVSLAAEDQSLRLKMYNIKDNSFDDDTLKPSGPVKAKAAYKGIVDVVPTQGDISVAMTDKLKCLENTSQQLILSAAGTVENVIPLKSASESNLPVLSSREAKTQGMDKEALEPITMNLRQEYWEQQLRSPTVPDKSLEMLWTNAHDQPLSEKYIEMETPSLEEASAKIFTKSFRDKLEFSIKQKMLYQLWGLPLVVQRSLDATTRTPPMVKDPKMPSKVETFGKGKRQKWNFPKRIVKSLKTFEMPKAMSLKNLSLGNENKPLKPKRSKIASSSDSQDLQNGFKRSAADDNAGCSSQMI